MYCGAKNLSSRISFCGSTLPDLSYQEMVLLDMWRMHKVPEIYLHIHCAGFGLRVCVALVVWHWPTRNSSDSAAGSEAWMSCCDQLIE